MASIGASSSRSVCLLLGTFPLYGSRLVRYLGPTLACFSFAHAGSAAQIQQCSSCSSSATIPSSSNAQSQSTHPPIQVPNGSGHYVARFTLENRQEVPQRAGDNKAHSKKVLSSHLVLDGVIPAHGWHILRHDGPLCLFVAVVVVALLVSVGSNAPRGQSWDLSLPLSLLVVEARGVLQHQFNQSDGS